MMNFCYKCSTSTKWRAFWYYKVCLIKLVISFYVPTDIQVFGITFYNCATIHIVLTFYDIFVISFWASPIIFMTKSFLYYLLYWAFIKYPNIKTQSRINFTTFITPVWSSVIHGRSKSKIANMKVFYKQPIGFYTESTILTILETLQ